MELWHPLGLASPNAPFGKSVASARHNSTRRPLRAKDKRTLERREGKKSDTSCGPAEKGPGQGGEGGPGQKLNNCWSTS